MLNQVFINSNLSKIPQNEHIGKPSPATLHTTGTLFIADETDTKFFSPGEKKFEHIGSELHHQRLFWFCITGIKNEKLSFLSVKTH